MKSDNSHNDGELPILPRESFVSTDQGSRFGITQNFLNCPTFIELNELEYLNLKKARENLVQLLYTEEKLNYVVENLRDLEIALLSGSVRDMIHRRREWEDYVDDFHEIVRLVLNILSTASSYRNQVLNHVKRIDGDQSSRFTRLKKFRSSQYNKHFSYRFMVELRNYSQHNCIPVHNYSSDLVADDTHGVRLTCYSVNISVRASDLLTNGSFKSEVGKELQVNYVGDRIDLRPHIRSFVAHLATFQTNVRKAFMSDSGKWEELCRDALKRYASKSGGSPTYVDLVQRNGDGRNIDSVAIVSQSIDRWQRLAKRNRYIQTINLGYVSSRSRQVVGSQGID